MKNLRSLFWLVCVLGSAAIATRAAEPAAKPRYTVTVVADRADALDRRGETATFTVRVEDNGHPCGEGEVEWALTKDGLPALRSGKAMLVDGAVKVTGTLD